MEYVIEDYCHIEFDCCKSVEVELKVNYYFLKQVHDPVKTIFLIEAFGFFNTTSDQKKAL